MKLNGGKNETWTLAGQPDVAFMALTQGQYCVFDTADWPLIKQYRWCARRKPHVIYAVTTRPGSHNLLGLHTLLCPCPPGHTPDHIDRDGLNNRRNNLRPATPKEQSANARLRRGSEQGLAKLSESSVVDIKQRYAKGDVTHRQLATEFGVGRTTVSAILAGKTWRHV